MAMIQMMMMIYWSNIIKMLVKEEMSLMRCHRIKDQLIFSSMCNRQRVHQELPATVPCNSSMPTCNKITPNPTAIWLVLTMTTGIYLTKISKNKLLAIRVLLDLAVYHTKWGLQNSITKIPTYIPIKRSQFPKRLLRWDNEGAEAPLPSSEKNKIREALCHFLMLLPNLPATIARTHYVSCTRCASVT